jgi:hypothetical protein
MHDDPAVLAACDQRSAEAREEAAAIVAFYQTLKAGELPATLVKELVMARYGWTCVEEEDGE